MPDAGPEDRHDPGSGVPPDEEVNFRELASSNLADTPLSAEANVGSGSLGTCLITGAW
jgi:hypothetical protein